MFMISDHFVYLVNTFMLQHKANLLNPIYDTYFKECLNVPYRLLLLSLGKLFPYNYSYSPQSAITITHIIYRNNKTPYTAMRHQEEWTQRP